LLHAFGKEILNMCVHNYICCLISSNHIVFFVILSNLRTTTLKFFYYIQGSGIALYVSYIHSRAMHVVLMERAWKDSKHIKSNTQNHQKATVKCFRNKAKKCLCNSNCIDI